MKKVTLFISIIRSVIFNFIYGFKNVLFIGNGILFLNKKTIIGKGTNIYGRYRIEVLDDKSILNIGNNVSIAENVHITCGKKIIIGNNVSIANNVTITDINHGYLNKKINIGNNPLTFNPVIIKDGSFIGCNVYISPGVQIGKHCFIGANSTVLKSIASYSVVVGSPAKVIKKI